MHLITTQILAGITKKRLNLPGSVPLPSSKRSFRYSHSPELTLPASKDQLFTCPYSNSCIFHRCHMGMDHYDPFLELTAHLHSVPVAFAVPMFVVAIKQLPLQ